MNQIESYMGMGNFNYFFGVVESRLDPLKVGRIRVRIYSWHDSSKALLPTESLMWAQTMIPVNSGSDTTPPREGVMVFGFFMDGSAGQFPLILGCLMGIPETNGNATDGFTDPRDSSSLQNAPFAPASVTYQNDGSGASVTDQPAQRYPYLLDEPQSSRVARNENTSETPIGQKQKSYTQGIPTSTGGTWDEPPTPYAAVYPYDRVIESESGHLIEVDDTPGAERLHRFHRSGTFEEIGPDGTKVTKVVKNNYTIIMSNDNVYVMGDVNVTIQGNCNLLVEKDINLTVKGNVNTIVKGNWTNTVTGNVIWDVIGNWSVNSPLVTYTTGDFVLDAGALTGSISSGGSYGGNGTASINAVVINLNEVVL